ncbi:MAG: endonuclease Q family protein [Syntrophorhabdaceae bacterium]
MKYIADLHIHSHYSISTSRDMTPEIIGKWAQLKGVSLIGTGDATHPGWLKELGRKLDFAGNGFFVLRQDPCDEGIPRSCARDIFFVISAEISCVYRKYGRTRKVHCNVLFNDMEGPLRLQKVLSKIGIITSNGRPILGLDAKRLLKIVMDECPEAIFIPAHIWTPHFSVLGSFSRFGSLEECFEELTPCIYAVETGLSSDPPMNWRVSSLDEFSLISNSDAHSPEKIGREANILDTEISFAALAHTLKTREGFEGTVEFFPHEGKYYHDGHRPCRVRMSPEESSVIESTRCPACGRKMTLGVLNRIFEVADRSSGFRPDNAKPYYSLISLKAIIADVLKVGIQTKKVNTAYFDLLETFGNELGILMDIATADITAGGHPLIADAIARVRSGDVIIEPGYDGEYGKIKMRM